MASGSGSTTGACSTLGRTSSSPRCNRHYDIVERYRSGSRDFDDRGVIYIRHGEPTSRATYAAPGWSPTSRGATAGPRGTCCSISSLGRTCRTSSWSRACSTCSASASRSRCGRTRPPTIRSPSSSCSRASSSRRSTAAAVAGQIGSGQYQAEERRMGQESIEVGTTTDSYELRFAEELACGATCWPWERLGRLAGADRLCDLGEGTGAVTVTRGYLYSVRVRFSASDPTGRVVASLDTTRHFVAPEPVPEGEHLVGRRVGTTVPTGRPSTGWPSSRAKNRRGASDRHRARGPPRRPRSHSATWCWEAAAANLVWRRADQDSVLFNPLETFKRSEEMQLYYEINGLRPGTPYEVRLAVRTTGWGRGLVPEDLRRRRRGPQPQVRRPGRSSPRDRSSWPAARSPQARELRAGGDGDRRSGTEGRADEGVPGGVGGT